jgi:ABC-type transport system substrate-binding protein
MFTDGFGEMTADDVKFSFERIGLPAKDAVATYKNDWLYCTASKSRASTRAASCSRSRAPTCSTS